MITSRDIDKFEAVYPLLVSITKSMTTLSTKKPSDIISEFKLDQINKILKQCNTLLRGIKPLVEKTKLNILYKYLCTNILH